MKMQISKTSLNHAAVLKIKGEFLFRDRRQYQKTIDEVVKSAPPMVLLDLSRAERLDSAAFAMIKLTAESLQKKGCPIGLILAPGILRDLFALTKFDELMPVYESEIPTVKARSRAVQKGASPAPIRIDAKRVASRP